MNGNKNNSVVLVGTFRPDAEGYEVAPKNSAHGEKYALYKMTFWCKRAG